MDKLSSISNQEGNSVDNSFIGAVSADSSDNCNQNESQVSKSINMDMKENVEKTISVPRVHDGIDTNPAVKTDTLTTTTANGLDDLSNKKLKESKIYTVNEKNAAEGDLLQNEGSAGTSSIRSTLKVLPESLASILAYGSSSEDSEPDSVHSLSETCYSDSDEDETAENSIDKGSHQLLPNARKYRENKSPSSSNSSDSDESSNDESNLGARSKATKQSKRTLKTEGELDLPDLPPIVDFSKLNLNVKPEDCVQMGRVASIVDKLVTIESLPGLPPYDLDTLLFLDEGKCPLGHIHDVLGQVTSPMYVVRFNSKEEIESKGITKGLPVYCAPNTEHTQYVFVKELLKLKGSDASWTGDNEVPQEYVDYSDDEAEYALVKQSLNEQDMFHNKRKRNSVDKHKMFETAMNLKNKVDSARHKMRDTVESAPKRYAPPSTHPSVFYYQPAVNQMRQHCSTSFPNFPPAPNFVTPPPTFGYVNMPPMLPMPPYGSQFAHNMPPFTPSPQPFPPGTFGPPAIPPLPSLPPHTLPQVPQPALMGSMACLPANVPIPKQQPAVSKSPKMHKTQSGGVVPKAQSASGHKSRSSALPKLYMSPGSSDYQLPYPPNLGLPKSSIPSFTTTSQPTPMSMPPSFGPPMPPWPYAVPRTSRNVRGFQSQHGGGGQQFKK